MKCIPSYFFVLPLALHRPSFRMTATDAWMEHLQCCICLTMPSILPVRPHGDTCSPCLSVMCQRCYAAWRRGNHSQSLLICPCCRSSIQYVTPIPPDRLLCRLLHDHPVQCISCMHTCTMSTLAEHETKCAVLLLGMGGCDDQHPWKSDQLRQDHTPRYVMTSPGQFCQPVSGVPRCFFLKHRAVPGFVNQREDVLGSAWFNSFWTETVAAPP